ncbi:chemotaxis protein CheB [Mycolicibacterium sp. BiH015]|uniref:chemotaxis protein CheB n=1 Tax=Mycolicibacterium sp. BiH015 TaxID=3018808 RepID=UPI0022E1B391|nr:chemotaxis protein CheB [Mycolicibacterium sp. BiH015]MDA2893595.1 chemotaxis protein CheB [Mycolicibacterium sp. BiH015]
MAGITYGVTEAQNRSMRGVVAIGGSAGGVEAFTRVAAGLPADLPYAVLMALHLPAQSPSVLAQIIDRAGPMPAEAATDGARLQAGRIYVAVPGHHLMTYDHRIVLSSGPSENGHRPALNALFRSVAVAFGPDAVGVLMSGVLDDGVLGLAAIRSRGGTTLCQSPDDALFAAMPRNALRADVVDAAVSAAEVGAFLAELADSTRDRRAPSHDERLELENRIAMSERLADGSDVEKLGPPSGFTCPDCNGSLQMVTEGYFRCHVGHAWTADALLSARDQETRSALMVAVRSLQEKSRLAHRLADGAVSAAVRVRYTALATETDKALEVLKDWLANAETETGVAGTDD